MFDELLAIASTLAPMRRKLEEGACLFRRGDPVTRLFFVVEGAVDLMRMHDSGQVLRLHRASAGTVLAEASIFSEAYHCDAVAPIPAQLISVSIGDWKRRLADDPQLAGVWTRYLSRQVQDARVRCEMLSLRRVSDRLDLWLASKGQSKPKGSSWALVAEEIGVSPEALYRELAKRKSLQSA
jgi:CRP-like cAMP-binding protein